MAIRRTYNLFAINNVSPWTPGSTRPVSLKPSLSRTRRDAVFQSYTVAYSRRWPDALAQLMTVHEASAAYP